ncbi:HTH-type transcriptional regulator [Neobacillus bataviensis LMG 21833]|uniref:HTH-type transcriptional regulator n=1 Tax=Neobacillus bataviensis LMG 21833 TaxID=1117379 RepID=K6D8V8_9BACI|nr:TetR/AcrR family transcriptional regulator [Neobacillus bataviensis]EKN64759.1 HTH-type transcriptional regulator [Neobacillus bataviensis LMG 21833]
MKKQLIMEKALELFAKQGFEATSVQQITDYCGISKGAFYLSFKSKDELIIALIDQFMMQIIADIDYLVKNAKDSQLLYDFYYAIYHSFQKHSDFAKVLMKEQSQTFNKDLILKMQYYDKLLENNILLMIERLYGDEVKATKYDLMYCIKGFMNMYSQLFVFYNVPLDLQVLSESLVEKTTLLARHMTVPFVTEELSQMFTQPMKEEGTKEQLGKIIEQKIDEMEESIEKESLLLLRQELLEPSQPPAVVKGLLENIRNHPHCKWISYLLRQYFYTWIDKEQPM